MLFAIAARLHMSVTDIESMSHRQVKGWVETFTSESRQDSIPSDAIDYGVMSKAAKKAAFR
jgi:hypothetical protein